MYDALLDTYSDAPAMARAIVECIKDNRLTEAETLLEQLNDAYPATRDMPVFAVLIALRRGRPHDAWQIVNGLPEDHSPELKALCLKMLDDPSWHSYAIAHEDSPDPYVRRAMRHLLGSPMADLEA
jgi:type III secretion protein HrpB1